MGPKLNGVYESVKEIGSVMNYLPPLNNYEFKTATKLVKEINHFKSLSYQEKEDVDCGVIMIEWSLQKRMSLEWPKFITQ